MRCCRGDRSEAEDVLHDSYCKVLDGRARFDDHSTFRTWLFGVIRRTALEHSRWQWRSVMRLERWWHHTAGEVQTAPPPEPDERVAQLHAALTRLSVRQQEMLHLVFYQELTVQEAADILGIPVGTARTHYERGKARLRHRLQGDQYA